MRAYLYRGENLYRVEDGVYPDYETWTIAHRKPLEIRTGEHFDPNDGHAHEYFRLIPGTEDRFYSLNFQSLPLWVIQQEEEQRAERELRRRHESLAKVEVPHGS